MIKLYKILRKNGISKNDVVWGIAGNKEFVLTDFENKRSYFYDFVIKSKKIIIEYNNLFWHPREESEWKGFGNYDEIIKSQKRKMNLRSLVDIKFIMYGMMMTGPKKFFI